MGVPANPTELAHAPLDSTQRDEAATILRALLHPLEN
jgi:hypothetical protein